MDAENTKLSTPVAIIIAGALIAVAVLFSGSSSAPLSGGAPSVNIKDVKVDAKTPFIGNANAPVTMAYWSDYQCPFCKAVEVGGVPQITIAPALPNVITKYVDTGKLKIVFKEYAFLSEDSTTAALYGHAMWSLYPDKFYTWRTMMFRAQDEEHGGFGNEESILTLMGEIPGVDAQRVKADVAANRDAYLALITADREEGAKFGITGTPAFIVGKQLIGGAQSETAFFAAIDPLVK